MIDPDGAVKANWPVGQGLLAAADEQAAQMKTLQKFSSAHAQVDNHFNRERHLVDRQTYKARRSAALAEWQIVMA